MFTGIVETTGTVQKITPDRDNLHFEIASPLSAELKIDQSISHNGVCLTVVKTENGVHTVTAIRETLDKSNLGKLQTGDLLNLERCMVMNGRLDGHIVQRSCGPNRDMYRSCRPGRKLVVYLQLCAR